MKTMKELTKELGISKTIIYRRIQKCNLDKPVYRKKTRGKERMFSDSDVEKIKNVENGKSGRPEKK